MNDIDEVLQKTAIEINEEGAKAAAVTIITPSGETGDDGGINIRPTFYANRPFAFIIREKTSVTILFTGRIYSL
ncbi:MAG: hypothetical protein LBH04_02810 [Tannerellaceae bacterium]|jgi:serpin B|nr:hypothetical protein [Tannerellaceae bacterium]